VQSTENFEVRNRFTNAVQFTAEIICAPDTSISVKLGLAVKWAVKAGANLALGRIFGMMQRPERDGDIAEYERCKAIFLNAIGVTEMPCVAEHSFAGDYRQILMSGQAA